MYTAVPKVQGYKLFVWIDGHYASKGQFKYRGDAMEYAVKHGYKKYFVAERCY